MSACTHLSHIHKVSPNTNGCEECLKMGDTWVHLRLCMECGHVGLLRLLKEQTRHETFSPSETSDYAVHRTRGKLGMVLHR